MNAVRVSLKYLVEDVDRHGNVRVYLRKPGQLKVRLRAKIGSPEFIEEYRQALERGPSAPPPAQERRTAPAGSLNRLALDYYGSAEWKALSASTRKIRRRLIDALCEAYGDRPANMLERKHIRALRDRKAETPHAADNWMKAMRGLFRFGVDDETIDRDPTEGIRKIGRTTDGFAAWELEDVRAFEAHHPLGTRARLALALLLYTGQRRSDVARLGPGDIRRLPFGEDDGRDFLCFTQVKNSERKPSRVEIPILPPLAKALKFMKRKDGAAFLLTQQGTPFTKESFGNAFRTWCDEAGLKGLSAHGLRKAAGAAMAESGCTEREIMAVLGHRSESAVKIYVSSADRRRLAASALQKSEGRLSHSGPRSGGWDENAPQGFDLKGAPEAMATPA